MAVASGGVLTLVSLPMSLRLKRREQKELVIRRARELAEPGRFEGWQSIVFQLRFFDGVSRLTFRSMERSRRNLMLFAETHGYDVRPQRRQQNNIASPEGRVPQSILLRADEVIE